MINAYEEIGNCVKQRLNESTNKKIRKFEKEKMLIRFYAIKQKKKQNKEKETIKYNNGPKNIEL